MPVGELLARVSSQELTEWMAYSQVEPWGEDRADLRSGIVAATVANAHRDKKKKHSPYKARDFIPQFGRRRGKSTEDMLRYVEHLNLAFGGRDLRGEREA